jgi:hypothetical protein
MNFKSRLKALENSLRSRLQGAMAHTLADWYRGGRLSPKLSSIIAERMAAPDDPLEAEPSPEPTTEGGQ